MHALVVKWPILHLRRAGVLRSGPQRGAKGAELVWWHYLFVELAFYAAEAMLGLVKKDPLVLRSVKEVAVKYSRPRAHVRLLVVRFQCLFDVCATLASSVVSRKEVSTLPTINS